jgi:hypothetical protein
MSKCGQQYDCELNSQGAEGDAVLSLCDTQTQQISNAINTIHGGLQCGCYSLMCPGKVTDAKPILKAKPAPS